MPAYMHYVCIEETCHNYICHNYICHNFVCIEERCETQSPFTDMPSVKDLSMS